MTVSRVAEWIEGGELPLDEYQLAGVARFHPTSGDVLAALETLAAENQPYLDNWQPPVAAKARALQRRIGTARQTFAAPSVRQAYDDWLTGQLRQAFAREFRAGGAPISLDGVRRWLRLVQHVHASRIDELAGRLMRGESEPERSAVQPAANQPAAIESAIAPAEKVAAGEFPSPALTPTAAASRMEAEPQSAPTTARRRRPPPVPDDFGLLWIVGSAIVTTIVCLGILLALFGQQIGATGRKPVTAHIPEPVEAPPPVVGKESAVRPPNDERPAAAPSPPVDPPAPPVPLPESDPQPNPRSQPDPAPQPAPPQPLPPGSRLTLNFGGPVHSLAWDGAGKQLAVGGDSGEIWLWNVAQNSSSRLAASFQRCTALAFSSSGRSLAAASSEGPLCVWDSATWKLERTIRHAELGDVRSLAWIEAASAPQIAVGDGAGCVRLFSATQGQALAVLNLAAACGPVQSLAVPSRSRPLLVSAQLDGTVSMWNIGASRGLQKCLAPPGGAIFESLAQPAAATSKGAELTLCDHSACYSIAVSRDEKLLALAAGDLELWELDAPRFLVRKRLLPGNGAQAYRLVAFSGPSDLLAAADSAGTVSIVDVATWTVVWQEKQPSAVLAIDWHPSAPELAIGRDDGTVIVVPVTSAMLAQRAEPTFDVSRLLATAQTLVNDENWYDCSRLINVVAAFKVPATELPALDGVRLAARNGQQAIVGAIQPARVTLDELDDATHQMQLAIDIDSAGPLGRQARDLLRQLPVRSPAALAKAQAKDAAAARRTPDGSAPKKGARQP